jgi:hypothetical protein
MPKKSHVSRPLARYANYFELGHNRYEFLIDFGQYRPESEDVVLHTRIALGPTYAKLLTGFLTTAMTRHEAEHGPVPDPENTPDPAEVVLRSLPDFADRAVGMRRRSAAAAAASAAKSTTAKR